jgi:hypothetical protein
MSKPTNKKTICNPRTWKTWDDSLAHIDKELHTFDTAQRIFSKLCNVIDKNIELQKHTDGLYFNWLIHNYCIRQGMGIRRLVDRWKTKNLNLRNLLKEMEETPQTLCIDNLVKHYSNYYANRKTNKSSGGWRTPSERVLREQAQRAFEDALGTGRTAITKKEVKADLKEIWNASKPIIDYVNEKFAHMGQFDLKKPIPIINEAHACIDLIIRIYDKYALTLGKNKFQGLPEIFLTDWGKPLRIPWVK